MWRELMKSVRQSPSKKKKKKKLKVGVNIHKKGHFRKFTLETAGGYQAQLINKWFIY